MFGQNKAVHHQTSEEAKRQTMQVYEDSKEGFIGEGRTLELIPTFI